MSAVRQSARKNTRTITTSTQPISSARFRLESDISMKVAGRKMVGVDLQVTERRLQRLERLLDVMRDLQRVGAQLLFDNQQKPGHVVDDRVADRRLVALHDRGDVADTQRCTDSRRHDQPRQDLLRNAQRDA